MSQEPIPTIVQGFNWTAGGAWASFIALCALIVRQVIPWRSQTISAEEKFRDNLQERVTKLEQMIDAKDERVLKLERIIAKKDARHEAERALDRHKFRNMTQCFDAIVLMLEAAPDRATEVIVKIKEMRRHQLEAEALENAAIRAAEIEDANGDDLIIGRN